MIEKARAGKRPTLPSTAEAKPELPPTQAEDQLVASSSLKQRNQIVGDLACKHGLSRDRAQMLVDRFGIDRIDLEAAAQTLRERRT